MNRSTAFPGASLVIKENGYEWIDFPIPGHKGELKATFLNRDTAVGPVMAALKMAPGSRIPAHYHERTTETFLVVEGEFINAGVAYAPGTFFGVQKGDVHGPHETKSGCTLVFVQAAEVDPTDFHIAD